MVFSSHCTDLVVISSQVTLHNSAPPLGQCVSDGLVDEVGSTNCAAKLICETSTQVRLIGIKLLNANER